MSSLHFGDDIVAEVIEGAVTSQIKRVIAKSNGFFYFCFGECIEFIGWLNVNFSEYGANFNIYYIHHKKMRCHPLRDDTVEYLSRSCHTIKSPILFPVDYCDTVFLPKYSIDWKLI